MRRFYFLFALQGGLLGGYFAIWQPKLLERGYTVNDLAFVLTLQTAISLLLDFPLGVIADRIGNKIVTCIGFCVYLLAFLLPSVNASPLFLAFAVLGIGVGDALIHGALDSWTQYHLERSEQKESDLHSFFRRDFWATGGRITGALAIPGLISLIHEPVAVSWIPFVFVAAILLIIALRTPADIKVHSDAKKHTVLNYWGEIFSVGKLAFSSRLCLWLLISSVIFGVADGALGLGLRPRIVQLGITTSFSLGLFQALLSVFRLIGNTIYRRCHSLSPSGIFFYSLIISGFGYIAFSFVEIPIIAIGIWLIRVSLLAGYFPTIKTVLTGTNVGRSHQASLLSLYGVVVSLGIIILQGGARWVNVSEGSLQSVLLIGGIATVISGIVALMVVKNHKMRGHIT